MTKTAFRTQRMARKTKPTRIRQSLLLALWVRRGGSRYAPRHRRLPLRSEISAPGENEARTIAAAPRVKTHRACAVFALILLIPVLAVAIVPNHQIFNAYLVWDNQQFDLVFMGKKLRTTWLVTLEGSEGG